VIEPDGAIVRARRRHQRNSARAELWFDTPRGHWPRLPRPLRQPHAQLVEVQPRDFLVEVPRQHHDLQSQLLRVVVQLDRREHAQTTVRFQLVLARVRQEASQVSTQEFVRALRVSA
jgi:hypothetical protein